MGGPVLRIALVAGGMMSGFGMFNALVMSYSRLPLAMAQDGMLPKVFAKLHPKSRAPWVAILALAVGWGLRLNLGFERLVTLDIMIYGASLALEFVALICAAYSRAGTEAAVPGARRAVWSDCCWYSSGAAARIRRPSQRARSCARA